MENIINKYNLVDSTLSKRRIHSGKIIKVILAGEKVGTHCIKGITKAKETARASANRCAPWYNQKD